MRLQPKDVVLIWASPPCENFSRLQQIRGTSNLAEGDACVATVMEFVRCVLFVTRCWKCTQAPC